MTAPPSAREMGAMSSHFRFQLASSGARSRPVWAAVLSDKFQGAKVVTVTPSASTAPSGANYFAAAGVEQIRAPAGKEFSITLPANHTTGYSWRLASALDPATLSLTGNVYHESTSGAVGASGEEVWTFSAQTKGTVELDFEYVRPFEKNEPPAKTAKFSVVIK
jgi:inhibitor of cysteine peptidase